jgi:ABC-2 type transport system permease protein
VAEALAVGRIYLRLVGARVRAQLQYRVSFALNLVGAILISFLDFAAILVLFDNVSALGGWSVEEVAFLYGVSSVAFGLTDLLIGHLDQLPELIRLGTFDSILIRPLGSLLQVVSSDVALRRIGKALQGLVVLAVAIAALDVDWDPLRVAMVVLTVLTGIAIYAGIWVVVASIAFWAVDSQEFANAFTYGGGFLAQYPVNIFGAWLRRLVIFVMPLAFVAYFPALYILDKPDPLGLPRAFEFAPPVVSVLTALAAALVWRTAVRRYRSVGA